MDNLTRNVSFNHLAVNLGNWARYLVLTRPSFQESWETLEEYDTPGLAILKAEEVATTPANQYAVVEFRSSGESQMIWTSQHS